MADEPKIVPKRPSVGIAPPVRVPIRPQSGDIAPSASPTTSVSIRPRTTASEDVRIVPRSPARRAQIERAREQAEAREALTQWQALQEARMADAPLSPVLTEEGLVTALQRSDKKRVKKFAAAIEAARTALAEARELISEISVEKAVRRLEHEIAKAIKADGSLARTDLLAQIGTSEQELEMLPILFFTTVTIVPVEGAGIATWTAREPRRGRKVRERSIHTPEPLPQLAPGGPIEAPRPKIVPLVDGTCRLELGTERYLMRRERSQAVEGELVGDDWWLYYPLSEAGTYDPSSPLLRTFKSLSDKKIPDGFTSEPPSYGPAVLADYVEDPLWALTLEIDDHRVTIATVLMKGGNIVHVEVPWHDDLARGEIEVQKLMENEWTNWGLGLVTFMEAFNLKYESDTPVEGSSPVPVPSLSA